MEGLQGNESLTDVKVFLDSLVDKLEFSIESGNVSLAEQAAADLAQAKAPLHLTLVHVQPPQVPVQPDRSSEPSRSSTCDAGPTSYAKEHSSLRHPAGTAVEYYSESKGQWIPAEVQGFDEGNGCYKLNVHPQALPAKVRLSSVTPPAPERNQQTPASSPPVHNFFKPGDAVEYYSASSGGWRPAVVEYFDAQKEKYKLDIHPEAAPEKVRAPVVGGSTHAEAAPAQAAPAQITGGASRERFLQKSVTKDISQKAVGSGQHTAASKAESSSGSFAVGTKVEYHSASFGSWITASVEGFDPQQGTYQLDVHKAAPMSKVRLLQPVPESGALSEPSIAQAEMQSTNHVAAPSGGSSQATIFPVQGAPPGYPKNVQNGYVQAASSGYPSAPSAPSVPSRACGLCAVETSMNDLLGPDCEHLFCKGCFRDHIMGTDFIRQAVRCPVCPAEVFVLQVRHAVGEEAFKARQDEVAKEDEAMARQLMNNPTQKNLKPAGRPQRRCELCSESFSVDDLLGPSCEHLFCRPCLSGYIKSKDFILQPVTCPSCDEQMTVLQVQHFVGEAEYRAKQEAMAKEDEEMIRRLQAEFEEEAKQAEEDRNMFECPICICDSKIDECITMDCDHRICVDCFRRYVESKIRDGQVADDELVCCVEGCKTQITLPQIQGATEGTDLWDKFCQFRMNIWKPDANSGIIVECPTPNCEHFMVENNVKEVKCPRCKKVFCPKCKEEHKGMTCEQYKDWKLKNEGGDEAFENLIEEMDWKRCPKCNAPSERESGCNFMQCRSEICRKRTYWCYVCGKEQPKEMHYKHYPDGPYTDWCYDVDLRNGPPPKPKKKVAPKKAAAPAAPAAPAFGVDAAGLQDGLQDLMNRWVNWGKAAPKQDEFGRPQR